jgi:hypothetical protein
LLEPKIRNYTSCGLVVTIAGLSLYSYHVRELLAFLALFSVAFFLLALVALGALLLWWASEQLAIWTRPASREVIASSRSFITARARSWIPKEPHAKIWDCTNVNRPPCSSSPECWSGESRPNFDTSMSAGGSVIPNIDQLERLPAKVPLVETQVH